MEHAVVETDYSTWNADQVIEYILQTHHTYVESSLPVLVRDTQILARVYGKQYPYTEEIAAAFQKIADDLKVHMAEEEDILFPYILNLIETKEDNLSPPPGPFGKILDLIQLMEDEHDAVKAEASIMQVLTSGFMPPADADPLFKQVFAQLKEFVADLHQHIHMENDILFPMSIQLEKEVMGD